MPAKYNFRLCQGTDFRMPLVLKDKDKKVLDLTGYKVAMQVRPSLNSQEVDTLTSENGRIQVTPKEGRILAIFPHEDTEKYPVRKLMYDMEITSSGNERTRILEGVIDVSGEVTRV